MPRSDLHSPLTQTGNSHRLPGVRSSCGGHGKRVAGSSDTPAAHLAVRAATSAPSPWKAASSSMDSSSHLRVAPPAQARPLATQPRQLASGGGGSRAPALGRTACYPRRSRPPAQPPALGTYCLTRLTGVGIDRIYLFSLYKCTRAPAPRT